MGMPSMPADETFLRKRKNTWYIRVRVPPSQKQLYGHHVERSLKTKEKAEAQRRRHAAVAAIKAMFAAAKTDVIKAEAQRLKQLSTDEVMRRVGKVYRTKGLAQAEELVMRWQGLHTDLDHLEADWFLVEKFDTKTESRYKHSIVLLREHLKSFGEPQAIQSVNAAAAMGFRARLAGTKLHRRTSESYLSALRSRWRYWIDSGVTKENPWTGVKMPPQRTGVEEPVRDWTDDELVKLFTGNCRPELIDLMALLLLTGARRDEIVDLDGSDAQGEWLSIRRGKNANAIRMVPIHNSLQPGLKGKAGKLFTGSGNSWTQKFMRYRRSIGLKAADTVLNSFRHTFMSRASAAGFELHKIQSIVGHGKGKVVTSRHYIHVDDETKIDLVNAVAARLPEEVQFLISEQFGISSYSVSKK